MEQEPVPIPDQEEIRSQNIGDAATEMIIWEFCEPLNAVENKAAFSPNDIIFASVSQITAEHCAKAIAPESKLDDSTKMRINIYTDDLIGYWIIHGRNKTITGSFVIQDEQEARMAWSVATQHIRNGDLW